MLVLILKCCVLQYRCIILIIENDFLRKTTYQSKFCEIKYLIKKINLFDNVSSRKAILLSCMSIFAAILVRIFPHSDWIIPNTDIFYGVTVFHYTHYIINVIYFLLFYGKKSLVHLIILLTHLFTDVNKYWFFHCLAN